MEYWIYIVILVLCIITSAVILCCLINCGREKYGQALPKGAVCRGGDICATSLSCLNCDGVPKCLSKCPSGGGGGGAPSPGPSPCPSLQPAPVSAVVEYFKTQKPFVKAVYIDNYAQWGFDTFCTAFKAITDAGFNVILLAFYVPSGAADWTSTWAALKDEEKVQLKALLASKNTLLLASWGGSSGGGKGPNKCDFTWIDTMLTESANMSTLLYDGIDLDLEWVAQQGPDTTCMNTIGTIYSTLQSQYGSKPFIFTSAPQTPYFSHNWALDYLYMEKSHPHMFDWYNVQFYSNGETNMTITLSLAAKMASDGIPLDKIVIGKCNQGCDETYYVKGTQLVTAAKKYGYRGVMLWEWSDTGPTSGASWFS